MGAAESSPSPQPSGRLHRSSTAPASTSTSASSRPASSSTATPLPAPSPVDPLLSHARSALLDTRSEMQRRITDVRRSNASLLREIHRLTQSIQRLTPAAKATSRDRSQSDLHSLRLPGSPDLHRSISASLSGQSTSAPLPVSPLAQSLSSAAPVDYDQFDIASISDPAVASQHLSLICSHYFAILEAEQKHHSELEKEHTALQSQLKAFQLRFKHYQKLRDRGLSIKEFDQLINQIHHRAGVEAPDKGQNKEPETEPEQCASSGCCIPALPPDSPSPATPKASVAPATPVAVSLAESEPEAAVAQSYSPES